METIIVASMVAMIACFFLGGLAQEIVKDEGVKKLLMGIFTLMILLASISVAVSCIVMIYKGLISSAF